MVRVKEVGERRVGLRVGHLLRVSSYLEIAIISMWTENPRADLMIGMVEASLRGEGPGGNDGDFLEKLRALVEEARDFNARGDFPAAMARMRVAQDMLDLRILVLSER